MNQRYKSTCANAVIVAVACTMSSGLGCIGPVDKATSELRVDSKRSEDELLKYASSITNISEPQREALAKGWVTVGMQREWIRYVCDGYLTEDDSQQFRLATAALPGDRWFDTRQAYIYFPGFRDDVSAIVVRGWTTVSPFLP